MSLIERLSQLTNPNPTIVDPEDDNDETSARLPSKANIDETIEVSSTKLQQQAAHFIDDESARYIGKLVSRKQALNEEDFDDKIESDEASPDTGSNSDSAINDNDSLTGSLSADEDCSSEADEGSDDSDDITEFKQQMNSKKQEASFQFEDDGDYGKYADNDEMVSDDYSEDSDEDDENSDDSEKEDGSQVNASRVEQDGIQSFSTTNLSDEISKGQAAKSQIGLWDCLLEHRIKLQKLLVIVNQLPQPHSWGQFVAQGGEEYQEALKQSEEAMKLLLDQLTQLQTLLLWQYSDTRKVAQATQSEKTDEANHINKPAPKKESASDEEIPSDEEIQNDDEEDKVKKAEMEDEAEEKQRQQLKRKIKMGSYPEFLEKRHKAFQPFRDETIQKWYDKTRVASGKLGKGFSAFESSALKQITQILSDKDRLIKRTQLKRSSYTILGKSDRKSEDSSESSSGEEIEKEMMSPLRKDHLKEYDEEIYDDDDFYHQLLRQLIERKTADVNDPIALSRQWLEIQKLRSKVKKNVDTKASKGRKIRYDIHTKLMNFMAPFETCKWTDQARNDLYNSLFDKRTKGSTLNEQAGR